MRTSQRALGPFLILAASRLLKEPLADESAQAGAGDVDRGLIGGQPEEFVQVANPEDPSGALVEGGHDALVDGGGPLGRWCADWRWPRRRPVH